VAAVNYIDRLAVAIKRAADGDGNLTDDDMPLYRIYAVLCLAKGTLTRPEDVHDAWAAWRATTRPDHPALVPFDALSAETQALDTPYVEAIHAVARRRAAEGWPG
jgi:hypothetical protein